MVLTRSDEKLQPGDKAPAFRLKNVDGKMTSLADFAGKPVAIIFMCNHCPYVKPKMQEIGQLAKRKDVVVLCINANDPDYSDEDSFENMITVAKRFGYPYYLLDETQDVARAYGAVCTPDPFLFDKQHRLVYHGRINDAMNPTDAPKQHDLAMAMDALAAGRKVKDWFVPSMGCSIKWRE
jgi:peroxiredoxin